MYIPRALTLTIAIQLVKNAMVWPFIQDGVPIMYYGETLFLNDREPSRLIRHAGQEQGYTGGNDPANREA